MLPEVEVIRLLLPDNTPLYSRTVDALIRFGWERMQDIPPTKPDDGQWSLDDAECADDLEAGLARLECLAVKALAWITDCSVALFHDPDMGRELAEPEPEKLRRLVTEPAAMDDAGSAFVFLDHLACCVIGLHACGLLERTACGAAAGEVERIYDNIAEQAAWQAWKLIPLNTMRAIRLQGIAEKYHYLFPWYGEWADVPADSLDILAENMAGIGEDGMSAGDSRLVMLQQEVAGDLEFAAALVNHAVVAREISAAFAHVGAPEIPVKKKARAAGAFIDKWPGRALLHDFFSSLKGQPLAGAAAMACLVFVVVLLTMGRKPENLVPDLTALRIQGISRLSTRSGGDIFEKFLVKDGGVLHSGDYYRVRFIPDKDGFVYLVQQGSRGRAKLLDWAPVVAGKEIVLPGAGEIFQVDETTGEETIYLLASTQKIPGLAAFLATIKDNTAQALREKFPHARLKTLHFRHESGQ